jgi:peptidoglycan/LPS O-acetylase OafA/YrhL
VKTPSAIRDAQSPQMNEAAVRGGRITQFDGLRALAFLGVFAFHAIAVPYAWMGVDLFFVLSGYLITRNLLGLRERERPRSALAVFYFRRLLRIVPPYYLALAAIFALTPVALREAPWYVAFASNIRDCLHPALTGPLLPMWSIAVEEQFYVIWPFIVLLAPRRALPAVFVAAIMLAPAVRLLLTPVSADAVYRLVISRSDLLALGALFAWIDLRDTTWARRHARVIALVAVAGIAVFALFATTDPRFDLEANEPLYNTVGYSLEALVFTCALILVRIADRGVVHRALCWRPLAYLGRISYMAYLVHVLVIKLLLRLPMPGVFRVALALAITVMVAAASWHVMEKPLDRLRRRDHAAPRPLGSVAEAS